MDARERLLRSAADLLQSKNEELLALRLTNWNQAMELARYEQAAQDPTPEPEIKFSAQPLYLSEEQEDIQYQYDHDLIDLDQYRSLLKELEFENAEVQLDEDFTHENFHY